MPSVILISAAPNFVSEQEYQSLIASTPSSFNDLPPVVKRQEENVSVVLDPPVEGLGAEDLANGTLFVLTSALVFVSTTGKAFQVGYRSITLHAVSRSGEKASIYCQLDEESTAENGAGNDAQDGEEEYTDMRELNIIPSSPEALEPIFEALSHCASLHPDPLSDDDMEDDSAFIAKDSPFEVFTGDGDEELSEVGKAALAHLESILDNPYEAKETQDEGSSQEPKAAQHPDESEKS
ncbi:regulator of volume decrease after cellular swelling-domain-containing protein [Coprinopsis sp. MPI-PUGE-AT-0042]|nr:regulator of volume decrease after cellular swelling-domain-containing protein [Coprinopsis sp. MPI-PUGE-AT-0042]